MSDLVACQACGVVFTREQAPSWQCPVCRNDGVESGGTGGLSTKRSWYESIGE